MENNKKFELSDDMLDSVAGGLLLEDEATDGRKTTKVRSRIACTKCGTYEGYLVEIPGRTPFICCADLSGKHTYKNPLEALFDLSKILMDSPTAADYTEGW